LFQPTLPPAPKNSEISGWQSGAPDLGRKLVLSVTLLGTVTRLSFGHGVTDRRRQFVNFGSWGANL
jgi:hypothetical protein